MFGIVLNCSVEVLESFWAQFDVARQIICILTEEGKNTYYITEEGKIEVHKQS